VIIGLFALGIFILELFETKGLDIIHLGESALYGLLLIIIGGLIEMLLRANNEKAHANSLLQRKHELSLELSLAKDFGELGSSVIKFLASTAHPAQSSLMVHNPETERFETVAIWNSEEPGLTDLSFAETSPTCQSCNEKNLNPTCSIITCHFETDTSAPFGIHRYCLPLLRGPSMVGLLRLILPSDKALDTQQFEDIQNIGTEVATALISIQQNQALTEISTIEAAQAERRVISRDLHDVLGQNLSYLRLMLDQFSRDEFQGSNTQIQKELQEMRDVADDSYELVRGILETLHPSASLPIANLILTHIRSLSERGNFEYKFSTQGNPRQLTIQASRQIFFACMEAIRNLAKHSGARNAEIELLWGNDDLAINICDDGTGFDTNTQQNNQHFGLAIMRERIEGLGGNLSINSKMGGGTQISFHLPLSSIQELLESQAIGQEPYACNQVVIS